MTDDRDNDPGPGDSDAAYFASDSSVGAMLAVLVLDAAIGPALSAQMCDDVPRALVVRAPGADWCDPLYSAAKARFVGALVIRRDGSVRAEKAGMGNDKVAGALSSGRHVIGISHDPDALLPATLTTVADARVVAATPDGAMLRRLIERRAGAAPDGVPDAVAAGLGFHDIVAAIRPGVAPAQMVAGIAAASSAKCRVSVSDDTPPLDRLPGYSDEVRGWGLRLAADIAAFREGRIAWKEVSASCVLGGPPGTGKTLFARSLAVTCGVPIVVSSCGDWFARSSGHLDGVVKAARDAFDSARAAAAPCSILFLDELDGIPDRRRLSDWNRDWWTPVVNYVLTLLDGAATSRDGMALLGATNHADMLDPALVRPGRFDRVITVDPPGPEGLADIVRFHLDGALSGADLSALTRLWPGASGAQAAQWARDARRLARDAGRGVAIGDLVAVMAPDDDKPPRDRRVAALHEAGHAVVAVLDGRSLVSVSTVSVPTADGGVSGGRTVTSHRFPAYPTRSDIETEARGLLGGRASEIVLLGAASMGAEGDLRQATALVAMLHASGGLGQELLHRAPPEDATGPLAFDAALRRAVADDLARIQAQVVEDVRRQAGAIDALAEALLARRFIDGAEAEAIVRKALAPRARRGAPKPGRTP
jgi:hypothetical protein